MCVCVCKHVATLVACTYIWFIVVDVDHTPHLKTLTLCIILSSVIYSSVRPADVHCKKISPLTYAKCGNDHVENSVIDAIAQFKKSLIQVGPGLSRGVVILSFYEKRENKGFFGMLTTQEKVYFERWRFPILVNENPLESSSGGRTADSNREYRHRVYETAREEVKQRMLCIFENANSSVDHVPASAYEFEIVCWMVDS